MSYNQCCWRKCGIFSARGVLSIAEEANFENHIWHSRHVVPLKYRTISESECSELCNLLGSLHMTMEGRDLPTALSESLLDELHRRTDDEMKQIVNSWVDIEDDEE